MEHSWGHRSHWALDRRARDGFVAAQEAIDYRSPVPLDPANHPLAAENVAFMAKLDKSLRELFDRALAVSELQFVFSLSPEFRGAQSDGWNTAHESRLAVGEYIDFISDGELTPLKARVALAFYCHLAEASGLYEIPKNMLLVAGGGVYHLWPFQSLVEVHARTGNVIAPNANKVLRDLSGHAQTLGLSSLAEVFRDAFDGDIRNGFAHADYIVWDDGIRLRRRNGGNPKVISWPEFHFRMQRGIGLFRTIWELSDEYMKRYSPARTFRGRYGNGRTANVTVSFDAQLGTFRISDSDV